MSDEGRRRRVGGLEVPGVGEAIGLRVAPRLRRDVDKGALLCVGKLEEVCCVSAEGSLGGEDAT